LIEVLFFNARFDGCLLAVFLKNAYDMPTDSQKSKKASKSVNLEAL
jgi:hypothetical protein